MQFNRLGNDKTLEYVISLDRDQEDFTPLEPYRNQNDVTTIVWPDNIKAFFVEWTKVLKQSVTNRFIKSEEIYKILQESVDQAVSNLTASGIDNQNVDFICQAFLELTDHCRVSAEHGYNFRVSDNQVTLSSNNGHFNQRTPLVDIRPTVEYSPTDTNTSEVIVPLAQEEQFKLLLLILKKHAKHHVDGLTLNEVTSILNNSWTTAQKSWIKGAELLPPKDPSTSTSPPTPTQSLNEWDASDERRECDNPHESVPPIRVIQPSTFPTTPTATAIVPAGGPQNSNSALIMGLAFGGGLFLLVFIAILAHRCYCNRSSRADGNTAERGLVPHIQFTVNGNNNSTSIVAHNGTTPSTRVENSYDVPRSPPVPVMQPLLSTDVEPAAKAKKGCIIL